MPRRSWIALLALTGVAPLAAGSELTLKLMPVEPPKAPYVMPVVAPGATCVAVGEGVGMVAIGQKINKEAHVTLYRLDAQGKPTGAPVIVKLPKPATLAAREAYPLSIVFHPSLPLLYVWQEVEGLKGDPLPPTDPAWTDFDHLLIYALDAAPELLLALCRGPGFHTGNVAGTLCLDIAHGRLFVPNLRFGEKNPPDKGGGVGWFTLGGDGLPIAGDEEPAKVEPVAVPAVAVAAPPARLAALRAALAAAKPLGAFRHTPPDTYGFGALPCGAGFIPISRDVFVTCGYLGTVTWNLADRGARAQYFLMPINFLAYYVVRIAGHPRLPVVYATIAGHPYAHRVEHADGNITLAPQVVLFEGAALRGLPVVLTKRNLVAWGTVGAIYLAAIDAEGRFKDENGLQVNVPNAAAEALAYSEKFDLLYVALEKAK